jgi:hypothetical protein
MELFFDEDLENIEDKQQQQQKIVPTQRQTTIK